MIRNLAFAAFLAVSAVAGDAPSLQEFEAADLTHKVALIRTWAEQILKQPKMEAVGPKSELWSGIQERLSRIPTEEPRLIEPCIDFYASFGAASQPCLTFCRNIITSTDVKVLAQLPTVLRLLHVVKGYNDALIGEALAAVPRTASPVTSASLLVEHCMPNPKVADALSSWTVCGDVQLRVLSLRALQQVGLTETQRKTLFSGVLKLLTNAKDDSGSVGHASGVISRLCLDGGGPSHNGALSAADIDRCVALISSKDQALALNAAVLVLIAADPIPDTFAGALLARFSTQDGETSHILNSLAFVADRVPKETASALLASARKHPGVGLPGLLSCYLQTGGGEQEIRTFLGEEKKRCPKDYWRGITGREPSVIAMGLLEKWADLWSKEPEIRPGIVQSLASLDFDTGSTMIGGVLALAIKEPWFEDDDLPVLKVLWRFRRSPERLKVIVGIRPWLEARAEKSRSPHYRVLAAGLLKLLFGDMTKLDAAVKNVPAPVLADPQWTPTLEVLLEVDKNHPYVQKAKECFAQRGESGGRYVGAEWLAWLLDLRLGIKPGPLPVISLALAIARNDSTCDALADAGVAARPYLRELRAKRIFIISMSGRKPDCLQRYIGVLDRIEMLEK